MPTTSEQNKALVLEAFDTLFNKRDYAIAERFWSPDYFSTEPISHPVVRVFSISSRAFRQRCSVEADRFTAAASHVIKVLMNEVRFEEGGTVVHMRKRNVI
jgi:hypothetical protein